MSYLIRNTDRQNLGLIDIEYTQLIVKLIFGTLEFFSIVVLSFALFRIPIRYNIPKMALVSLVVTLISLFQRDYLDMGNSAMFSIIISYTLLVSFLFNIQLMFSFVISLLGYIAFSVIQLFLIMVATLLGVTNSELLISSALHRSLMQVICLIVVLALVYWLSIKKLGFVFFRKRISFNNQKTRMHNILLLFILMMGIGVIQLAIVSFTENLSLIYVLTGLIVIAAVGLMITYIKNKKEIDEKIDRTKKLEK